LQQVMATQTKISDSINRQTFSKVSFMMSRPKLSKYFPSQSHINKMSFISKQVLPLSSESKRRVWKSSRKRSLKNLLLQVSLFIIPLVVATAAGAIVQDMGNGLNPDNLLDSFKTLHSEAASSHRHKRFPDFHGHNSSSQWPVKRVAEIPGDIVIGGLHMIHEREDAIICGPVMPQGGLQAWMSHNMINKNVYRPVIGQKRMI